MKKLWWRIVFWWKKRTGFIDFHKNIEFVGTVVEMTPPDLDGDRCFNVRPDPGFEKWITLGDRMTAENEAVCPAMQCEVTAWASDDLKATYDRLGVGARVRVRGAWGFDGVHINGWPEWIQILLALFRHMPDMQNGWFEIHPVTSLEGLD